MQVFIRKPSVNLYPGIRIEKDTVFEYETEYVKQSVKDMVFHSVSRVEGENYKSVYDTTIKLEEGDILIFDGEKRGYVKPVDGFVSVDEAISDLENIRGVGE
jgi:hypothetical protein